MDLRELLPRTIWVLLLAALLLGVPRVSGVVASLVEYHAIDPDGA